MAYNFIETIAKVTGQGAASCFSCGFGETCLVGLPRMLFGDEVKITDEMIPDVTRQPEVMQAARDAGRLLGERLRQLRIEHRDLDDVIHRLQLDLYVDQVQLRRLKKRKLVLKDQIARLESQLIPDLNA